MSISLDVRALVGLLLVLGPVIGAIPVGHPRLIPVWSMDREDHLATVGAHRTAWAWLNAGFTLATVATSIGLVLLPVVLDPDPLPGAALTGVAVSYAIGGLLWCAVLAIRTRTTPTLADLVALGRPTEPAETLLGALNGGLFAAFILITSVSLITLGLVLVAAGGIAPIVALVCVAVGILGVALQLRTGDFIPATLYLPTMLLGIALLVGWD
jgi:hypothetical protein